MRIADLFCGAGGAGMGLHRAGFEVVGFDIEPQKNYPFEFHQADALEVDLSGFDAVWASPPCQAYSVTRVLWGREHPDLMDPTRELLEQAGKPWIIENVVGAPMRADAVLCGVMFGLRTFRHRWFEANLYLWAPPHQKHSPKWRTLSADAYSAFRNGATHISVAGHNFPARDGMEALGIDWMSSRGELSQAIPPTYSEYLGRQMIEAI